MGKKGNKLCEPVACCIYCDSVDDLTDEHVIAKSLGGRLLIPKGSCKVCAVATSRTEYIIARTAYHEPRARFKSPTRNPKELPKNITVRLRFANGGKRWHDVPIEQAPLPFIIPRYAPAKTENGDILSTCTLSTNDADEKAKSDAYKLIFAQTGAAKVDVHTGSFKVGEFERLLWKSAYGFFWIVDPESTRAADIAKYFTLGDKGYYTSENGGTLLFRNIVSADRERNSSFDAKAVVYTKADEEHRFIYCELDFFAPLGMPKYTCRIPNANDNEIAPRLFEPS